MVEYILNNGMKNREFHACLTAYEIKRILLLPYRPNHRIGNDHARLHWICTFLSTFRILHFDDNRPRMVCFSQMWNMPIYRLSSYMHLFNSTFIGKTRGLTTREILLVWKCNALLLVTLKYLYLSIFYSGCTCVFADSIVALIISVIRGISLHQQSNSKHR